MKALLYFNEKIEKKLQDIGILFSRISVGLFMLIGHGVGKIENYSKIKGFFPDPLGLGTEFSLVMAIITEVVCSILLILGLATRYALMGLIITMMTIIFIVHKNDPMFTSSANKNAQELPYLYLFIYLTLFLIGAGKYSVDYYLKKK